MIVTTTLTVVVLAGALGGKPTPSWQSDYAQAMAIASSEQKPIAVFISHGAGTPGKMINDGTIPENAARLLRESYVCLYLDTDTGSGKDLAEKFALKEGLVISSPGGNMQALRHNGPVNATELNQRLEQFAHAGQPTTTINTGIQTVASAPVFVGGCASGNCYLNSYPTAGYVTQPAAGQIVYPAGYSFGSSCPNGRCPNAR
ncbi:MAG: hypothetical protein U0792_04080 [Gemmataceae bacterium]